MSEPVLIPQEVMQQLTDAMDAAEQAAAHGCGMSDVLYEKRVQSAYAKILDSASSTAHEATKAVLLKRGYDPDYVSYRAGPGECHRTGLNVDSCPCGRHE